MVKNNSDRRNTSLWKILSYSLQLIILALLAYYLYQNRDALISFRNVQWQHVVWVVLLEVAMFLINSYLNYLLINRLDPRVSFLDCVMLQYVNNLLNKVLPTIGGGATFRAYYLKKRYQFPYTQFVSTLAGLYIVSFFTTSLIGIVCLIIIYAQLHVLNWVMVLIFIGMFIPTLFVILFSPRIPDSSYRLVRILKNVIDGWNMIKQDSKMIMLCAFLWILMLLLTAAYTYVSYEALGVKTSFIPMIYLATLGIIITVVNFTPDGIGIKEGVYLFSQELVQIPEDLLVLGSLYLRGISMVSSLLIGSISYRVLMIRLRNTDLKRTPAVQE